jgi:hypothetical protein
MKKLRLLALLCVLPALLSCTFLLDFWRTIFPEAKSVTLVIPVAGGTLSLNNDQGKPLATLQVPAGAVASDTAITIAREPSGYTRMGDVITVSTEAKSFAKPITLTIDYTGFAAASGLAAGDMGVYTFSPGVLSPVMGAQAQGSTGTFALALTHFGAATAKGVKGVGKARGEGQSGAFVGASCAKLTAEDLAKYNALSGGGLTAELIAMLDEVWLVYTKANTDPPSKSSFDQGVAAVKGWCDGRADLVAGSGWVEDRIVAGYELEVESDFYDFAGGGTEGHYSSGLLYGTQGEGLAENYLVFMCVQDRQKNDPTVSPAVNWQELFDIYVRKSWATPKLGIAGAAEVTLAAGETATLSAALSYSYIDREGTAEVTAGKSGESIGFALKQGQGNLSAASALTDGEGKAGVDYTAAWATSELDNEQAVVEASFIHGRLELGGQQVVMHEGANPLIESTTPFDGQTEVATSSAITVRFKEAMQTGTVHVTVSPSVASTEAWTEGSTLLTLSPTGGLAASTKYTVTVVAGAAAASGTTLALDYTFRFTTKAAEPPSVVDVDPANGATDVPVNSTVTVTFSKLMTQSATEGAFSLSPAVAGTFSWPAANRMTFTPTGELSGDTSYTVTVGTGAQDEEGQALWQAQSSTFTTEQAHNQVGGYCYWPHGNMPASGVIVELRAATIDQSYSESTLVASAVSDAAGYWVMRDIPPGQYWYWWSGPGYCDAIPWAPGFRSGRPDCPLGESVEANTNISTVRIAVYKHIDLESPANGSVIVPNTTFKWTAIDGVVAGGVRYTFWSEEMGSPDLFLTETSYTSGWGWDVGPYMRQVEAYDDLGTFIGMSDLWTYRFSQ